MFEISFSKFCLALTDSALSVDTLTREFYKSADCSLPYRDMRILLHHDRGLSVIYRTACAESVLVRLFYFARVVCFPLHSAACKTFINIRTNITIR